MTVSFALQKLCSFISFICQFSILEHKPLVFCSGKFPQCPCDWDSSPLFLLLVDCIWFEVEILDLLELKLCTGWQEWIDLHSSTCWPPVEQAPCVENAIFFPFDSFNSFVKDQVNLDVWVYFWVFNFTPLVYLPVCVNTIQFFLSQLLYNTAWVQGWWFPQKFFYCWV